MPEQERSIKERDQELFVEKADHRTAVPQVKPFPIYLRETPASPISPPVKAVLWVVGVGVLLLFCVALWRSQRPPRPHNQGAARAAPAPG
jgi:hypothetical protein